MFAKDQFRESFFLKSNLPDYSASRKTNRNKLFGNICYKQKRKKTATHVLFLRKHIVFFSYIMNSVNILTKRNGYLCQLDTVWFLTVRLTREKYYITFTSLNE